jgi:hypothetical protein
MRDIDRNRCHSFEGVHLSNCTCFSRSRTENVLILVGVVLLFAVVLAQVYRAGERHALAECSEPE